MLMTCLGVRLKVMPLRCLTMTQLSSPVRHLKTLNGKDWRELVQPDPRDSTASYLDDDFSTIVYMDRRQGVIDLT